MIRSIHQPSASFHSKIITRSKHVSGFTLLEFILVIAIAAFIFILIARQYTHMQWQKNFNTLLTSANLGKQGLNLYFFHHKSEFIVKDNPVIVQVPYQDITALLNKPTTMLNPWSSLPPNQAFEFWVTCKDRPPTVSKFVAYCVLSVQTKLDSFSNLAVIAGIAAGLGADYVAGTHTISWNFIPDQLSKSVDPDLWVIKSFMDYSSNQLQTLVEKNNL